MADKYKVIHVIGGGEFGGAEEHILQLLSQFPEHGIEGKVVCFYDAAFSRALRERRIAVEVLKYGRFDPRLLRGLEELFRRERPAVIHTHGVKANFFARLAARKLSGIPLVTTVHSILRHDYANLLAYTGARWMEMSTRRWNTHFIAVSEAIRHALIRERVPESRITVVHHGIDTDAFRRTDPSERASGPVAPAVLSSDAGSSGAGNSSADLSDVGLSSGGLAGTDSSGAGLTSHDVPSADAPGETGPSGDACSTGVGLSGAGATIAGNSPKDLRKEWNLPDDAYVIGAVTRLVRIKCVDTVIRAVKTVSERDPRAYLVIVGTGPEEERLKRLAHELGVHNRVRFAGFRRDIPDCLRSFDAFVSVSLSEGLGLNVLEAMATGLPAVVTGVGGVLDFARDGENVLIVPVESADAVADRLLRLMADRELAGRLADTAAEHVRARFSLRSMAADTVRVYDALLGKERLSELRQPDRSHE
jgi:Glycosyltransferase